MSNDAEELGIKLAHARHQAMSHQYELQVFIDLDKLIDIANANKLWSAAGEFFVTLLTENSRALDKPRR